MDTSQGLSAYRWPTKQSDGWILLGAILEGMQISFPSAHRNCTMFSSRQRDAKCARLSPCPEDTCLSQPLAVLYETYILKELYELLVTLKHSLASREGHAVTMSTPHSQIYHSFINTSQHQSKLKENCLTPDQASEITPRYQFPNRVSPIA